MKRIPTLSTTHGARLYILLIDSVSIMMLLLTCMVHCWCKSFIFIQLFAWSCMIYWSFLVLQLDWLLNWIKWILCTYWSSLLDLGLTLLILRLDFLLDFRCPILIHLQVVVLYLWFIQITSFLNKPLQILNAICATFLYKLVLLVKLLTWCWLQKGLVTTSKAWSSSITVARIIALVSYNDHCLVRKNFGLFYWFFLRTAELCRFGWILSGESTYSFLYSSLVFSQIWILSFNDGISFLRWIEGRPSLLPVFGLISKLRLLTQLIHWVVLLFMRKQATIEFLSIKLAIYTSMFHRRLWLLLQAISCIFVDPWCLNCALFGTFLGSSCFTFLFRLTWLFRTWSNICVNLQVANFGSARPHFLLAFAFDIQVIELGVFCGDSLRSPPAHPCLIAIQRHVYLIPDNGWNSYIARVQIII